MSELEERIEMEVCVSAGVVGERLRKAADAVGYNKRVLAFYLWRMEASRLFQMSGHGSTVHFAETQLDMEARKTRELIKVGQELENLQLVDRAFRDGEISWSRVLLLLRVVQVATQDAWAEFARSHTCRELREEVFGCDPGDLPGAGNHYGLRHRKVNFEARLGDDELDLIERARMLLSESSDRPLSDEDLLIELARRTLLSVELGEDRSLDRASNDGVAERNRDPINDEIVTTVLHRDQHSCRSCGRPHDTELHHIVFRRHGGSNESCNLLTLCHTCHENVHRGYLRILGSADSEDLLFTCAAGFPIERGGRSPDRSPVPALA